MKKSQGEIFGIALLFVVILIGVIVYAKIQSNSDLNDVDLQTQGEYKILAEGTLNTLLKVSTGCTVERNKDSVKDLINFCLENEGYGGDVEIGCDIEGDGILENFPSCAHALNFLNDSLYLIFNSSSGIGLIPFELIIDVPSYSNSIFFNESRTNLGDISYRGFEVNDSSRINLGYKRESSGRISWRTAQRDVNFELYVYYR
ncbi:MAG: hypothetical protein PF569_08970 [Candidatus Woesearchaeota archaeon]|jgi:hypothetical protein|nr:hypothetical protein [Candidatus Woesearchaeota archaeon]